MKLKILSVTVVFFIAFGTAAAMADDQAASEKNGENTVSVVQTDPAMYLDQPEKYYLMKGKTFDTITSLLDKLPAADTGLIPGHQYYRINKDLIDDFFYAVHAYDTVRHQQTGSFLAAKDGSCVWRTGKTSAESKLLWGTAETLMRKVDFSVSPKKIPLGSIGTVHVSVPGAIPYDVSLTSLNTTVAEVTEQNLIRPKSAGKTTIVAAITVGGLQKNVAKDIRVVNDVDDSNGGAYFPSIGIGIGIGHHHHGGISIGIGGW